MNMRKFIRGMTLDSCQNILRLNKGNLKKKIICIDIDNLWVGIVIHQLVEIITESWPLNRVRIVFLLLITRMNG